MLGISEHKLLGLIENDKRYKHYVLLSHFFDPEVQR